MNYYTVVNEECLAHHGILGMHWGIRRFQPYPKGYKGNGKEVGGAKKVNQRNSQSDNSSVKQKKKLTPKQKKAITNAVIIVSAAVLTGIVAHEAYRRVGAQYIDKVIKSGTTLQTLSAFADRTQESGFYAAYKNSDKDIYKSMFAKTSVFDNSDMKSRTVLKYDINNKLIKDMKVASINSAAKEFVKMYKEDSSLRNYMLTTGKNMMTTKPQLVKVIKTLNESDNLTDKQIKDAYKLFNTLMIDQSSSAKEVRNQFYSRLIDKGYSAILDYNDTFASGFNSKAPVIVIDNKSLADNVVKRLTESDVQKSKFLRDFRIYGQQYLTSLSGEALGVAGAAKAIDEVNKASKKKKKAG